MTPPVLLGSCPFILKNKDISDLNFLHLAQLQVGEDIMK